jgi:hypothetical protein
VADQIKKKPAAKKKARDEFNEEEIFQAPVITREPSSRQVKLGGKVVIRVSATGKPLPSFQWYHNGKKIVGATMDRLTLSKVRRMAAGAYHCEVKNFVGKATSRVCMLSFFTQRIPKLVIGPEISKLEEGKPFTLKVTSPSAAELKDYKIYWTFNGMRIKGAHGAELHIAAAKEKYEGEYKAMIATGGSLETSNVAKLLLKAPKNPKAAEELPEAEEQSKSLEDILAQEPTKELEAPAPKKPADNWEDFTFNPEDDGTAEPMEASDPSLVAPAPGSELFGSTSPGTPGAPKSPISQLATQDLIRELAEQGGASDLLEKVEHEDPSALILAAGFSDEGAEQEDPSGLIEAANIPVSGSVVEKEDPSRLILAAEQPAPSATAEDPSALLAEPGADATADDRTVITTGAEGDLIQDWGIAPAAPPAEKAAPPSPPPPTPIRASPPPAPNLKLVRKKEFLEKLLGKWQSEAGKKAGPKAA